MRLKETRTDGTERDIAIFKNDSNKYQFVNLTKGHICPCEFDSEKNAFSDLYTFFESGKIKSIEVEE